MTTLTTSGLTFLFLGLLPHTSLSATPSCRTPLFFPDLPGLVTLRCDFHLHTAFSDGRVWPDLRVTEAWRDGLDVIAITDHMEILPHKADLPPNYGRAYEIARAAAESLGLVVISGAEITRGEPPGHLNALFLTNVAALDQKDYRVAVSNAFAQGAFVFWNHPGWQQPGRKAVWYAEQGEFLAKGWLHGLEIFNSTEYEAIPHQWSLDKRLTILGNSDAHDLTSMIYTMQPYDYRPITLVFARDRSLAGIRDALFGRQTAVFASGRLFGEERYLAPLFQGSLDILNPEVCFRGKGRSHLQIHNRAALPLHLRFDSNPSDWHLPAETTLAPGKVSILTVTSAADRAGTESELLFPCRVMNLLVAPDQPLNTAIRLKPGPVRSTL